MATRPLRILPVLLLGAGLWGGACRQAPVHPLHVEYAGCAQVFVPGPACALDNGRRIHLWVDLPPETPVEVRADGRLLKAAALEPVQGGQRLTVDVPQHTWEVQVGQHGEVGWALALRGYPWPPEETRAFKLWRNDGNPEAARRLLAPLASGPPRAESWLALHLLTVISHDMKADSDAEAFGRQAVAAENSSGSVLAQAQDAALLIWIYLQGRRFDSASRVLSDLHLPAGAPAEAVYYRSFYRGLLAEQTGDARSALTELRLAVDQAERVGQTSLAQDAEQILGRQLQEIGRTRDAVALFDRLRRSPSGGFSRCEWPILLTNQAWSLLLAGEAGESPGDPLPLLAEAGRAFEQEKTCQDALRLGNVLNMALAHLQRGRLAPARASLDAARGLDRFATPLDRLWSLELEARLDLAEGRSAAALQLYDRLDALAASTSAPEGRWRAAYGRARCYRAMGRSGAALEALAGAESLLDQQSLQVPVHEGRATFAAQREGATRLFLELLLAEGRNAEALDVVRRARSRLLRQLARGDRLMHLSSAERARWENALTAYWRQRRTLDAGAGDDWKLPADQLARVKEMRAARYQEAERALDQAFTVLAGAGERSAALPPLRDGEVVLAYHPLSQGWAGFAADGRSVAVHRFELPEGLQDPAELSARLLTPFRAQIERARRVRVLPYGRLRDVDFHALPFDGDAGGILLAGRPVVYGLDLTSPAAGLPQERRALVVADPLGDLPAADLEAGAVTAALSGQRPAWSTEVMRGEAASADAVRPVLGRVDLLHYAGHGVFSGSGGWESVLPLAAGTRLTLGDLLALGRPPAWVVLSGCETGRAGGEAPAEGLGLAQAFLLAGSRSVIAATRPVGDRAAQGLFTELYRSWSAQPDLPVLLQQAQLAWRRREPAGAWASFRLFEP